METIFQAILIFLHTLVAWFLVEWFFNKFHNLDRKAFVVWHYVVVCAAFVGMFLIYFGLFASMSVLMVTLIAGISVLIIEFIVFRLLYSGELWFFNLVDWVIPVGIALSSVFLAGQLIRVL